MKKKSSQTMASHYAVTEGLHEVHKTRLSFPPNNVPNHYFSFFYQEIGQYTGYGHDYTMTVNKGWKILNSQNVLDSIEIQHKTHQDLNDPVLL